MIIASAFQMKNLHNVTFIDIIPMFTKSLTTKPSKYRYL